MINREIMKGFKEAKLKKPKESLPSEVKLLLIQEVKRLTDILKGLEYREGVNDVSI